MTRVLHVLFTLQLLFAFAQAATNLDDAPLGFGLVCGAGAATMLGAGIVFLPGCFAALTSDKFLASCLAIAAGVMLYVSMVEIFVKSVDAYKDAGEKEDDAYLYGTCSLFGGMIVNMLLGK